LISFELGIEFKSVDNNFTLSWVVGHNVFETQSDNRMGTNKLIVPAINCGGEDRCRVHLLWVNVLAKSKEE
jgi:hypothetical protein